jgi:hypothetical protein
MLTAANKELLEAARNGSLDAAKAALSEGATTDCREMVCRATFVYLSIIHVSWSLQFLIKLSGAYL